MPIIVFCRKYILKNKFKFERLVDFNHNSSTKPFKVVTNLSTFC